MVEVFDMFRNYNYPLQIEANNNAIYHVISYDLKHFLLRLAIIIIIIIIIIR